MYDLAEGEKERLSEELGVLMGRVDLEGVEVELMNRLAECLEGELRIRL